MLCLSLLLLAMQNPDLDRVAQWMTGAFDTFEQVAQDEQAKAPYQHVRAILKIKAIELAGLDLPRPHRAFYLEQALAESADKPYRQRVIVLMVNEKGELLTVDYRLAGSPDAITKDTLRREAGCEVRWTKVSENRYRGEAGLGGGCKTTVRGATHVESRSELTPHSLTSLDQGFDDAGAHKWGPPPGTVGHIFRKRPE